MRDLNEELWLQIINVDPEGEWLDRSLRTLDTLRSHFPNCASALGRLQRLCSAEDIARVSRFVRYGTCFGVLYSIYDPGFPNGSSFVLTPVLKAVLSGKKADKKMSAFQTSVHETLSMDDGGEWLAKMAREKKSNTPFGDVGATVKRLLNSGANTADLAQLAIWSRYDACEQAFRLIDQAGLQHPDDTVGLHESLLGSDPSGKEGRPGSWPTTAPKKAKKKAGGDSIEPLWKMRSGQAIAFSPDGKLLAVGGASGPARLYDAPTGKEQKVCEGIKANIYHVAFSPDGMRLAVADISKRLTICDVATGRLMAKSSFPDNEVSGLEYSRKTGELIRSAWTHAIDVIDPSTALQRDPLCPAASAMMIDRIGFFPQGDRLLAVWSPQGHQKQHGTVWRWPERTILVSFELPDGFIPSATVSPDSKVIAITVRTRTERDGGVLLFDADRGTKCGRVQLTETNAAAFLPSGVLVASDATHLRFFEPNTWKMTRSIKGGGEAFDIAVSPTGELIAVSQFGGVRVWRL